MISTFLFSCVDTLAEKIPESAKDFDYKTNATWAYASATTFMTGFYADAYTFVVENHNVLLYIFHLILFVDFFVRRSRLISACMSLTKDKANVESERRLHTLARVVNDQKFEEKERILECFQRNYSTQQKKTGDIVEPVYPDGHETQEMVEEKDEEVYDSEEEVEEDKEEEEKYGSDPEWVPRKRWDASDDEDDESDYEQEEIDHDLMVTMVNMAQCNGKKSYFFEADKSKSLENLIDLNGLKCSYSYHPTPGYTLSGYRPVVQV
jgi:hypothetical protein